MEYLCRHILQVNGSTMPLRGIVTGTERDDLGFSFIGEEGKQVYVETASPLACKHP